MQLDFTRGQTMKLVTLKIALVKQNLTQADLARAIDRSPSYVCRVMLGRVRAHARDRKRIAQALGVAELDLFPRNELFPRKRRKKGARRN
jgi:transcriptional regulator with XRE-family HTH domain